MDSYGIISPFPTWLEPYWSGCFQVEDNAWLGLLDPFGLLTADTPPAAPVTAVTLQASPAPSVDANRRRGFMTVYSNPKIGKKSIDKLETWKIWKNSYIIYDPGKTFPQVLGVSI